MIIINKFCLKNKEYNLHQVYTKIVFGFSIQVLNMIILPICDIQANQISQPNKILYCIARKKTLTNK